MKRMSILSSTAERILSLISPAVTVEAACIVIDHYCWCTATCVNECVTVYDNCPTRRVCVK